MSKPRVCPKCGDDCIRVKYVKSWLVRGREYLDCYCYRCEYRWEAETRDKLKAAEIARKNAERGF